MHTSAGVRKHDNKWHAYFYNAQIIDEISERREFLQSMRANGRGQEYEATVKAEVSQRLAQLRRLGVDA